MAECTASGVPREAFQPGDLAFPPISLPPRAPLFFPPSGNTPQTELPASLVNTQRERSVPPSRLSSQPCGALPGPGGSPRLLGPAGVWAFRPPPPPPAPPPPPGGRAADGRAVNRARAA